MIQHNCEVINWHCWLWISYLYFELLGICVDLGCLIPIPCCMSGPNYVSFSSFHFQLKSSGRTDGSFQTSILDAMIGKTWMRSLNWQVTGKFDDRRAKNPVWSACTFTNLWKPYIPQVAILVLYPSFESQCINLYCPNSVLYIFHTWFDWILKMQGNCCPGRLLQGTAISWFAGLLSFGWCFDTKIISNLRLHIYGSVSAGQELCLFCVTFKSIARISNAVQCHSLIVVR